MRTQGPPAVGGIPTVSGFVDGLHIHWLGTAEMADDHEQKYRKASRLLKLMIRNALTLEGLSLSEGTEAHRLIAELPETETECWVRSEGKKAKAIADTGLCRGHNLYALHTRN